MSLVSTRVLAAALAILAALVLTVQATNAAFTSSTDNSGNAFGAGTVTLTDADSGVAMFNATNLAPYDTATGCIDVTYSGSLDAEVRLFGAIAGGTGLEGYLTLDVERGTGDCASFGTATLVWDGTVDGDLGSFLGAHSDFATGIGGWSPTGGGPDDTVPFRFTVTLQDDNNAQGETATVAFSWESRDA